MEETKLLKFTSDEPGMDLFLTLIVGTMKQVHRATDADGENNRTIVPDQIYMKLDPPIPGWRCNLKDLFTLQSMDKENDAFHINDDLIYFLLCCISDW